MASRPRGRDASGHVDPFYQRRRRYEAVLRSLNLWEAFSSMPRWAQQLFWQFKSPDPTLVIDPAVLVGREGRALRAELEQGLRQATVEIDKVSITVRDFYSVLTGAMLVTRHTKPRGMPHEVLRFLEQAGPRLDQIFKDFHAPATSSLYFGILAPLLAHSRIDRRLLPPRLELERMPNGKLAPRIKVTLVKPQTSNIRLEGGWRPVYRAVRFRGDSPTGMSWISWTGEQLGRSGTEEQFPVWVQSHALRQLHARVNLPAAAPYLEAWLAASLAEPKIIDRTGKDLMVEYQIKDHRVGYLIVSPLEDQVVVRTFKFLTMEGSPEARLLEKRLRLKRRDAEWLGLHDLSAFTQTDLRDDPILRPMLEECGCGHLFTLAEDTDALSPEPKAYAAEVRRYLRMAA